MAHHSEEELEVSARLVGAITFAIITALVIFTIFFEQLKEHLMHHSPRDMIPIINSLFGEMTILGFLNLIMYCIHSAGILEKISADIIGNQNEEARGYITELFEKVHYLVFMIMVLFIAKCLFLLRLGTNTVKEWKEMNKACMSPSEIEKQAERYRKHEMKPWWNFSIERDEPHRFFAFLSMRREMISGRNHLPPFELRQETDWMPTRFDYAEYLSTCLGHYLGEVIEMPPLNLAALWAVAGIFFALYILVGGNTTAISILWIMIGLSNMGIAIVLEWKANEILSKLLNPLDFPKDLYKRKPAMRFDPILHDNLYAPADDPELEPVFSSNLPYWTRSKPVQSPDWIVRLLGSPSNLKLAATLQSSLFWWRSSHFHRAVLRMHMLFSSVYIALVFAIFAPVILTEQGPVHAILYVIVAMLPIIWEYTFILQDLLTIQCQISCSGFLRQNFIVEEVLRTQKARMAFKAVMVMISLVNDLKSLKPDTTSEGSSPVKSQYGSTAMSPDNIQVRQLSYAEQNEITEMFSMYCNADNVIGRDDMGKVTESLGLTLSEAENKQMFDLIDSDGDGTIAQEEFMAAIIRCKDMSETGREEKAQQLFKLFDKDGSGEIQISELIDGLKGLKHGMSTDDMVQLAHDIDVDKDGLISLEEFRALTSED